MSAEQLKTEEKAGLDVLAGIRVASQQEPVNPESAVFWPKAREVVHGLPIGARDEISELTLPESGSLEEEVLLEFLAVKVRIAMGNEEYDPLIMKEWSDKVEGLFGEIFFSKYGSLIKLMNICPVKLSGAIRESIP